MPKVEITELSRADIQEAYDWWSENHSAIQATEWYEQLFKAIASLQQMPERCPKVPEAELSRGGVRQLLFGLGARPTHRIVFHFDIDADTVTILRVRHHGQGEL
ncbi:type II toxin-antitoxin system RelE/ParE family toxin [Roseimaritima ulvae]|uniref:Plasmid stabilization system protein n=1 Tax=Roseimaritima ulvae TaxID=980254 RepID=A0A5B9QHA3_9BACT|nr:type II toxin-antitoxin system RelE/ParE family toxin [Roseimaritima ulvae]QEG38507.1 Plasmid stabilization system protein [Roseimaritima ulvae]